MTAACPPPQAGPENPQNAEANKPAAPAIQDAAFDLDEVKLTGVRFVPEGFGLPRMVRVVPKKPVTLDKQRKAFASAKPERKALEVKLLTTALWDAAKAAGDDEAAAKALREEAQKALIEVRDTLGEKADAIVLQQLLIASMWVGDDATAMAAGGDLLTRFPTTNSAKALHSWVVFLNLRNWQTAEAAKLIEGWTLDSPDINYLRAYVMAWVAFRMRDYDNARAAVIWAAKNWKSAATRPAIERDLVLMLSRSGTPVDDAAGHFAEMSQGNLELQYMWLYKLYEGFELAGYRDLAAEALRKGLSVLGEKVPPEQRVSILQRQSTNYLYANKPENAATTGIEAQKALLACSDKCTAMAEPIAEHLRKLASFFHTTYSVTQDNAYYGPAKQLYEYYVSLGRADGETIRGYLSRLEETKERAQANASKHDANTMDLVTGFRNQSIKACYEAVLQSETELKGSVKLTVDVSDAGSVSGAATEPAAGAEGMAAVAGCMQERAKMWSFPGRTVKGTTKVSRSYNLEPQSN
ncbi:MAG: AgmX/PglI C-terminal domain-containing protein [Myxococcota bacterium]